MVAATKNTVRGVRALRTTRTLYIIGIEDELKEKYFVFIRGDFNSECIIVPFRHLQT